MVCLRYINLSICWQVPRDLGEEKNGIGHHQRASESRTSCEPNYTTTCCRWKLREKQREPTKSYWMLQISGRQSPEMTSDEPRHICLFISNLINSLVNVHLAWEDRKVTNDKTPETSLQLSEGGASGGRSRESPEALGKASWDLGREGLLCMG